jgi:predicted amidohydrolase YtcJ
MRILDSAVNRVTRSGRVLGEEHKLSPLNALKAITIWGAYQHFEEHIKGSIKKGKQADFVVLDSNPLKIPTIEIKDIKVLQTINDDKTIYSYEI